jgi:hypothetical protein
MGLVRRCDSEVVAHCILGLVKEVVGWAFVASKGPRPDLKVLAGEMIAFTLTGLFKVG